jgi:hypothetical protein
MSDNFDRVLASTPVNKAAALVTGKGEDFNSKKMITQVHSHVPLPTIPFRAVKKNSESIDLTGMTFGRFTVIGYSGKTNRKGLWVVRCVCGRYATRHSRSVKNPLNQHDSCEECRQTAYLRKASTPNVGLRSGEKNGR